MSEILGEDASVAASQNGETDVRPAADRHARREWSSLADALFEARVADAEAVIVIESTDLRTLETVCRGRGATRRDPA